MSTRIRITIAFLLVGISWGYQLKAQDVVPSMGKEFWLGFMKNYQGPFPQSLDVFISSYTNTSGTISISDGSWSSSFTISANVTTTVTVPLSAMHQNSGVVENKGILIETADTVAVFAINFEQYSADGSGIYPTQSLGTEYRIFAYPGIDYAGLTSELLIVATEDGTELEIIPSTNTLNGPAAGVPLVIQLDAGESYQLQATTWQGDLTGTTIKGTEASGSCRPFAVFSGSVCTNIPGSCTACDHIFSQNLPSNVWGSTYHSVPFSSQTSYTYRILADTDNTVVTLNGANPVTLNAGQFVEVNSETAAICFEGNQPFGVAQYMEGASCSVTGDPALLILNAVEQKIDNITFATVVSTVIDSHFLNIIVDAADAGQVYLDGNLIAQNQFNAFTGCPSSVYATLPIPQGSHNLSCSGGLTGYVYGTGSYESYAYSVGSFTPVPPINLDSVYCGLDANGNITLAIPEPLFNPYWTTLDDPNTILHNGATYTFMPTSSNIYVVTGSELASGCEEEFLISVELDDPLELTVTASSSQVCAYTEVQLGVTAEPPGTYTYTWSPGATLNDASIASPIATPGNTTQYSVLVSTLTGCAVAVDSVLVNVTNGNVLSYDAVSSTPGLCLGDSAQLEVVVNQLIAEDAFLFGTGALWQNVVNGSVNDLCGSVTGNALYFNGTGNRYAQTVALDVTAGGTIQFALKVANGTAPCADAAFGQNILLEYSTNGGGAWTLIQTYFESQYPDFTMVNAAIPAGAQTANTMFRWSQPVNGGAGQSNWMLDDVAIGIIGTAGLDFAWTPASELSDPLAADPMAYPVASGWYAVDIVDQNSGCSYTDSVHIEVGEPFSIDVPADTTICDLAGIQLYALPSSGTNHTWAWTPNNGTLTSTVIQSPVATPSQTTTYGVTVVTGQGCVASEEVTIIVNQLIGMNITTPDDDLCLGESTTLNTSIIGNAGDLVFTWSPVTGLSDPGILDPVAEPAVTTNYILTAVDTVSGCQLIDSILITVSSAYDITVTNDTAMCNSVGFQLFVSHNVPNGSISWSPPAYLDDPTSANPTITWPNDTEYIVEVTDAIGCAARDTVTITVAFSDMVFYPDSSLCQGDEMVIDAGFPGSSYEWSTGATTQSITVDAAGDYSVILTDDDGCQTTFTTAITVDPLPVVDLGPDQGLCIGENSTLNSGSPGPTFLWSTQATSATITVNSNGNYWLQVTDANYCVNSDTVEVIFTPLPTQQLSDVTICVSETVTLDAGNPGCLYEWSTGETTQTIDVTNTSGLYSVIISTTGNCTTNDEAQITFIEFPIVDIGPDSALCDGESITLDASSPSATGHLWSTGETTSAITLTASHNAWVEVTNGYCTTLDSAAIVFNPLPELLLQDTTVCVSETIVLDAGNDGSSYIWSNGETSRTITLIDASGTYEVIITSPENCTLTDEATVVFIPFPIVDLGPDTILCDTEVMILNAANPGASITWSNGSNEQIAEFMVTHSAWVDVFNGHCTTRDSVEILFNPLPLEIVKYHVLCLSNPPYELILDAQNPGCSYHWVTGSPDQSIIVREYGLYSVLITTPENCSLEQRILVEEYCPPEIYLPNSFTPDGDGINDHFGPAGHNVAKVELLIFDRWGELIFQGADGGSFWDGTAGGVQVQDGVYVWKMKYRFITDVQGQIGPELENIGHVTVVR
jgi:gliding motility-associated-like protein